MPYPHENDAVGHFSPDQIQTRWMRHMRRGEWEAAWRISDEELRRRMACGSGRDASCPRHCQVIWDVTPLEGKRVLVRCYHGMGDTDYWAISLRATSDADSIGVLTELALGYRQARAKWEDGSELQMTGGVLEGRIGVGADVRLSPVF